MSVVAEAPKPGLVFFHSDVSGNCRRVEGFLAHVGTRPRTLHGLLDVAVEASSATGQRVQDEPARATLERIAGDVSASSKLGKLARALLDR